jgi:hypothetical protein
MTVLYTDITDLDQATIAEADAYHAARGNATWTGTDELKTQALTRAWDYICGIRWVVGIFDDVYLGDDAETAAQNAQIVAALRELVTPGVLLPDLSSSDFLEEKEIPGIRKKWRPGAPTGKRIQEIEALVRPYTIGRGCVELMRG